MANDSGLVLVTGATGKTGRRVAERLQAAGRTVRAGSRNGTPRFDWEDASTWSLALEGASSVYVAYQPDLSVPGAVETVRRFFAAAKAAGVRQIVLLSGRGEVEAEEAEQALMATGLTWTILRASWFNQNFSEYVFLEPLQAGELALPVGDVPEPFIDIEDIAEIAADALLGSTHDGRLYEVTGPQSLTFAEAVAEIARATGRDLRFVSVPAEAYRAAMLEADVPRQMVELTSYLFGTILDGRNRRPADGVQQALGRPAAGFADYVRRTAITGVWN